uniref:Uncharacterized protein n=1 Tax=Ditylenchus dipsaci TaxID=166011 RepID=A0A915EKW6_9BILA
MESNTTGDENQDLSTLTCPKCSDRLDAMPLKFVHDEKDNTEYQIVWWTCRGLKKKTCIFPLNVPTNVFWTRRTMEQMRQGLLPPPNIHLLPEHLHYLYPNVFNAENRAKEVQRISKISSFTRKNADVEKEPAFNNDFIDVEGFADTFTPSSPVVTTPSVSLTTSPIKRFGGSGQKAEQAQFSIKKDQAQQLKYGESDSRRNVDVFADTNSALSSHLSLRFSTDSFLSHINSEMSRKKLIQPPLAIGQKQRLRFANFVDKYKGLVQPSALEQSSAVKKPKKSSRKRRRTSEDRESIASALKQYDEAKRARNLSVRLGREVTEPEPRLALPGLLQPSCSSENYLQPLSRVNISSSQEMASSVGYTSPCSSKNNDFTDSNRAESSSSASTANSSTQASSKQKKNTKNVLPFDSMGDPELDKLVELKFKEVMANAMFSKKKKKKTKRPDSQQSSQLQGLMPITTSNNELAPAEDTMPPAEPGYTSTMQYLDPEDPDLLNGFDNDFYQDLSYGLELF